MWDDSLASMDTEEKEKAKRMSRAKLIVRCRHFNFQPVRDKRPAPPFTDGPFEVKVGWNWLRLAKRAIKRPPQQPPNAWDPSATHLNKALAREGKESNESAEGRDAYSNEVIAPTALPQYSCFDTLSHSKYQLLK
ncbi:hypothetical protein, unlikely [Trypanosoma congolense IL3000]|uniref:Uncharacterized protein n=1 Tax=Trypanosoma congolense (strain IL3000) TaxID=1068625 RepID=F9WAE5_TRYCI|nr:hypothetical protein, unlikely [Trypanosoma congolense IL3000]